MLVLRRKVARDRRFWMLGRVIRAWQHRLEKELVGPSEEEGAHLSGKIKTRGVLIEKYSEIEEKKIHFPIYKLPGICRTWGQRGELGPCRKQRSSRTRTKKDKSTSEEQSTALAQRSSTPPLTHLHKHPLNLKIILKRLIFFQRKDKKEIEALQKQGWEPRFSNSAQCLLQRKSRGKVTQGQNWPP